MAAHVPFTHIVTRSFETGGVVLNPGEPVDASNWKNTERLEGHYLRLITQVDLEMLAAHPRTRKSSVDAKASAPKRKFVIKKR